MLIPVILSGGSGTRLWPLSRKLFPKQLMPIFGGRSSLLQITAERAARLPDVLPSIIVTNENHRFMVASQLVDIHLAPQTIILEPEGRNTAPAVAVAALAALRDYGGDTELLVLPADHYISDVDTFTATVTAALPLARQDRLVTFGIVPHKPETGYGYIKTGQPHFPDCPQAFPVAKFVEKPDLDTARDYVANGQCYWNSGMFLFRVSAVLKEFERLAPDILRACGQALDQATEDLKFLRLDAAAFRACPSDSIDYALMEKTDKAAVVALDCGWTDVGSWSALYEMREKDENGNVCIGDIMTESSTGCYLHSTTRLIAALGLQDVAIIETKDAILAAPLDKVQDVKGITDILKREKRQEAESHCKVYRPWGNYESIDYGGRYQVKRIIVYPGQMLSLQKHHHRSEHWVIVKGTAVITKDTEEMLLTEDQSVYIPLGAVHRLHNPGKVNLELIEIQTGSYLGEDDIVRLDDVYGRGTPNS